jgi:hypothetical protein
MGLASKMARSPGGQSESGRPSIFFPDGSKCASEQLPHCCRPAWHPGPISEVFDRLQLMVRHHHLYTFGPAARGEWFFPLGPLLWHGRAIAFRAAYFAMIARMTAALSTNPVSATI